MFKYINGEMTPKSANEVSSHFFLELFDFILDTIFHTHGHCDINIVTPNPFGFI